MGWDGGGGANEDILHMKGEYQGYLLPRGWANQRF